MAHSLRAGQYLAMPTYSFRLDFSDETYDVVSVDAPSLEAALALLPWAEDCTGSMFLGSLDRTPQTALAFG